MKKCLILTSVLALAACGGGSGGGKPGIIPDSGMRASETAITSNSHVTSMASEILVAKDGTSPSIVRSGTVTNGGKEYISYHLDDAKFYYDTEPGDEYVSFGIDEENGRIKEIRMYNGDKLEEMAVREDSANDDSSVFRNNVYKYNVTVGANTYYTDSLAPKQYTVDEIKNAFRDAWEDEVPENTMNDIISSVTENMEPTEYVHRNVVDLQGKGLARKLRYADFGYTTILAKEIHEDGDGVGDDNNIVYGGYEIKEIKNPENLAGATFTGKAIAALGPVHENGSTKIETGDTATQLQIDASGNTTLTMPFNNWYTVTVNKPVDGNYSVSWTGDTSLTGENTYALDSEKPVNNLETNIIYYGDNNVASEAVGGVGFQNNNVEFNGAFGVAK